MSKVPLELVYIVWAFTAATGVLAIDRIYTEASRSYTEDERVLYVGTQLVLKYEGVIR